MCDKCLLRLSRILVWGQRSLQTAPPRRLVAYFFFYFDDYSLLKLNLKAHAFHTLIVATEDIRRCVKSALLLWVLLPTLIFVIEDVKAVIREDYC